MSGPEPSAYAFADDNTAGVNPAILEALARASHGSAPPYGADVCTRSLDPLFSEIFERECFVFPVPTGHGGKLSRARDRS